MLIQPVILLSFANNRDAYLASVVAEQKAIKQSLLEFDDRNYIQVRDVNHTTAEELFFLINRYRDRVQIFHYAGHADGQSLHLEAEFGVVQTANVKGIAGLLGTLRALKLVFLNGCATKDQVAVLLKHGVAAVIATSVSIDDNQAQVFASQFYQALGSGSTLREAFIKARAFLEAGEQAPQFVQVSVDRGAGWMVEDEIIDTQRLPWGLYCQAGREEVLDWTLPCESPLEIHFQDYSGGNDLSPAQNNGALVNEVLKAIRESEYVKELARKINDARQKGDSQRKLTDAEKKDAIIRAYPLPLSVQLRTLFSRELSERQDEERLRALLECYDYGVTFLAFILLSDLWDQVRGREQPLDLTPIEKRHLQAFFELNQLSAPTFDYFLLVDALLHIAARNDLTFYLQEMSTYREGWSQHAVLRPAHAHFEQMRSALESDIPSRLIGPFCLESERQLTAVLAEWHFLVHYKMAVIKQIEVYRVRNLPPMSYLHRLVDLDNNYQDIGDKDRGQGLPEPTDMQSILFYREQLNESLNLSPFILDENALKGQPNSKTYFFYHHTNGGLLYRWIENEQDTLLITPQLAEYVPEQFATARQDLLAEAQTGPIEVIHIKKDILEDDMLA